MFLVLNNNKFSSRHSAGVQKEEEDADGHSAAQRLTCPSMLSGDTWTMVSMALYKLATWYHDRPESHNNKDG
jgi:hypothetical protein